ncbi:MAG: hypothetical protein MUE41_12250 [Gemmatimonadaceae bacterium]|jgi:hypothetical protein|nr:hypothetical protein [Gemmatimonadaceae bacterium]
MEARLFELIPRLDAQRDPMLRVARVPEGWLDERGDNGVDDTERIL